MPETAQPQTRLHWVRGRTRAILDRLDAGDKLSSILSQAKAVTDDARTNPVHSFWIEFEIYGLQEVPLASSPFSDPDQGAGSYLFVHLHSCSESKERVPTDQPGEAKYPRGDKVDPNSIASIEESVDWWHQNRTTMEEVVAAPSSNRSANVNQVVAWANLTRERERILRDVRAHLYEHLSRLHRWASAEIENVALLGPDYRIVLDSLDALKTDVRGELVAALENLSSTNPAAWSVAALACRNVILALGRTLWQIKAESYESELAGKTLDLKGEREVNQLSSFIDYHYRRSDSALRVMLQELDELARSIYGRASAGKQQGKVRYEDAQRLIVDTFDMVARLDKLVGLEPIDSLSPVPARTTL